jgi:hypothetical protein
VNLWLDLGFQGAETDYGGKSNIHLPYKRPRKSKKNPDAKLTGAQEKHNRRHAKTRVPVEHAIGGMKSFHCLMHRIRNHLDSIIDSLFWIPAGLWNLKISVESRCGAVVLGMAYLLPPLSFGGASLVLP